MTAPPTLQELTDWDREGRQQFEKTRAAEAELLRTHQTELQSQAQEVFDKGATIIRTKNSSVDARLIRFWNGKSVLDIKRSGPRSRGRQLTEIDRGVLDEGGVEMIKESLARAIVELDVR